MLISNRDIGNGGKRREQAITELVQVRALKHAKNTIMPVAKVQYYDTGCDDWISNKFPEKRTLHGI